MLIIGHRGCYFEGFNQNTLHAFKEVIARGAKAIEFDVQKTSDDELVIVHNLDLREVSTGEGLVSGQPLSYIRSLHAGDPRRHKDQIPMLEEVLELIASYNAQNRPCLHLELKGKHTGKLSGEMVKTYIEKGWLRKQDFLVSSFIWSELAEFRSICADIDIALLSGAISRAHILSLLPQIEGELGKIFAYEKEAFMLPKAPTIEECFTTIEQNFHDKDIQKTLKQEVKKAFDGSYYDDNLIKEALNFKAVSLNLWFRSINAEFIQKAHKAGLKILLYTMNEPKDIEYYGQLGIDGYFTDFLSYIPTSK